MPWYRKSWMTAHPKSYESVSGINRCQDPGNRDLTEWNYTTLAIAKITISWKFLNHSTIRKLLVTFDMGSLLSPEWFLNFLTLHSTFYPIYIRPPSLTIYFQCEIITLFYWKCSLKCFQFDSCVFHHSFDQSDYVCICLDENSVRSFFTLRPIPEIEILLLGRMSRMNRTESNGLKESKALTFDTGANSYIHFTWSFVFYKIRSIAQIM